MFGIRRVDRMRNASIRERCIYEWSVLERIERKVLKWFGHVVKRVYRANLEGSRGRGRPQRRWGMK